MAKKNKTDEQQRTKTEQLFIDTFGEQEQAHESNYVTIGKLKELLSRASGDYKSDEESEESESQPD